MKTIEFRPSFRGFILIALIDNCGGRGKLVHFPPRNRPYFIALPSDPEDRLG
jgi:hypothetical protein